MAYLALAGAVGCGAALAEPSPADVQWASRRWPQTTLATLQQGRDLYVRKCAGCHALVSPVRCPAEQWSAVVARMAAYAKLKGDEQELIARYLAATSDRLREDGAAPTCSTSPPRDR